MMTDIAQYVEIGGIAGLFALFIVQYFQVQKTKKDPMNGTGKAILDELQKQNTNHLEHLQSCTEKGFDKISKNQEDTNKILFEILGIIKSRK